MAEIAPPPPPPLGALAPPVAARLLQVSAKCGFFFTCPEGFKCCGDDCCQEFEIFPNSVRIFSIIFLIVIILLSICGLAKYFCGNCKKPEPSPPMEHQGPPAPSSSAPLEQTRTFTSEAPPPYSEIIHLPVLGLPPAGPPPPYSFRPEEHPGIQGGIDNPAF
ncbi:transmembrane protein 92 [Rhynchocyon petersi]